MTLGGISAYSTPLRSDYVRLIFVHFLLGDIKNSRGHRRIVPGAGKVFDHESYTPARFRSPLSLPTKPWRDIWSLQCRTFLWWDPLLFDAGSRLWEEATNYEDQYFEFELFKTEQLLTPPAEQ